MEVLKYLFFLNLIILGTNTLVIVILWRTTKIVHYKRLLEIWISGIIPMIFSAALAGKSQFITGLLFSTNFFVYATASSYFSEISYLPFSWKRYLPIYLAIVGIAATLFGLGQIPERSFWFCMNLSAAFPVLIMAYYSVKRISSIKSIIVRLGTFNIFCSACMTMVYWIFYDNFEIVKTMYLLAMIFVVGNSLLLPGIAVEKSVNEKFVMEYELKNRAREQYQARLISLGVAAGGVAHEINNPLFAIQLSLDQFERRHYHDETVDFFKIQPFISLVRNHANKISDTVQALTRFSGASEIVAEKCELTDAIEGILIFYKEKCRQNDVELSYENEIGTRELPISYYELVHVLDVVLKNAFEAVRFTSNRWIKIHIVDVKKKTSISVENSGPPIAPELREQIFRPFFTTKTSESTGLGLSVAKGIIDKHKGQLLYDDKAPHTTFKIII